MWLMAFTSLPTCPASSLWLVTLPFFFLALSLSWRHTYTSCLASDHLTFSHSNQISGTYMVRVYASQSQKTTWGSCFSPSTLEHWASDPGGQAWKQAPLPAECSDCPMSLLLKNVEGAIFVALLNLQSLILLKLCLVFSQPLLVLVNGVKIIVHIFII